MTAKKGYRKFFYSFILKSCWVFSHFTLSSLLVMITFHQSFQLKFKFLGVGRLLLVLLSGLVLQRHHHGNQPCFHFPLVTCSSCPGVLLISCLKNAFWPSSFWRAYQKYGLQLVTLLLVWLTFSEMGWTDIHLLLTGPSNLGFEIAAWGVTPAPELGQRQVSLQQLSNKRGGSGNWSDNAILVKVKW